MRKLTRIALLLFILQAFTLSAQVKTKTNLDEYDMKPYTINEFRPVTSSLMAGAGFADMLDTYLSPLDYKGYNLSIRAERERYAKYMSNRINRQVTEACFIRTKSRSGNGLDLGGLFSYNSSTLWEKEFFNSLSIAGGPMIGCELGFIYNLRNGNNPASAILDVHLEGAMQAKYKFFIHKWAKTPFYVSLQWDLPVIKTFFCPNYGQSYYEIFSLGNTKNVVHFGSFGKGFDTDINLSIDVPLWNGYIKCGVYNKTRNMHVNSLKRRMVNTNFMIGYTRRFVIIK